MISVVIPAYNEASGIESALDDLVSTVDNVPEVTEVIVVDDGSMDDTADIARQYDVEVIEHERNRGYGASLKTGIRAAANQYILITDADGTYPAEAIPRLTEHVDEYDMITGARRGDRVNIPTYRRPAKWFLLTLANYLVDDKIPDLNSGMRIFRKDDAMDLFHILPSGFSFTTTITLSYHTFARRVKYVPIDYLERDGESKIRPVKDGMNFIFLILRTITYFKPLRVFFPAGLFLLLLSFAVYIYTDFVLGLFYDTTTVILAVFGIQVLMFGLLADLIVRRHNS